MAQRSLTAWFTLPGLRDKAPPTPAEAASFDALLPKLGYLSKTLPLDQLLMEVHRTLKFKAGRQ